MRRHPFLRRRWLIAGSLLAAVVIGTFAIAQSRRYAEAPTPIAIEATAINFFDNRDPTRHRFGALEFRGGLAFTSSNPAFGGISGIHMEPDGARFIAITDRGSWLRGRIVYHEDAPDKVIDAEIAPILGPDGKPLAAQGLYDTEAIAERDGILYVGIERAEQVLRFDYKKDGLLARGKSVAVPAEFKTFTHNKGLECLAAPPKGAANAGALIAIAESSLDAAGNFRAFLLRPEGGSIARFSVKRIGSFDVSDCTILPPGDLLLLERSYSPVRGVAMRIRRVPLDRIKPRSVVDGEIMIEADLGYQIDNMEGMAVHRNARGETILTLVSDDNFSPFQRNLLLQFALQ